MTQEEADLIATRLNYITLMGSKTKVSPEMLRYSPTPYTPELTDEDYTRGMFPRFFARKSNDPNSPCIEISMDEYRSAVKSSPFYTGVVVKWKITGSLEDIYSDDGIMQEIGVVNYNKKTLSRAVASSGIKPKLSNFVEFYKPS